MYVEMALFVVPVATTSPANQLQPSELGLAGADQLGRIRPLARFAASR